MSAQKDWQRLADASDEIAHVVAGIPGGDHGFTHTAETRKELQQAARLFLASSSMGLVR